MKVIISEGVEVGRVGDAMDWRSMKPVRRSERPGVMGRQS